MPLYPTPPMHAFPHITGERTPTLRYIHMCMCICVYMDMYICICIARSKSHLIHLVIYIYMERGMCPRVIYRVLDNALRDSQRRIIWSLTTDMLKPRPWALVGLFPWALHGPIRAVDGPAPWVLVGPSCACWAV